MLVSTKWVQNNIVYYLYMYISIALSVKGGNTHDEIYIRYL